MPTSFSNPLVDRLMLGLAIVALAAPVTFLEIARPPLNIGDHAAMLTHKLSTASSGQAATKAKAGQAGSTTPPAASSAPTAPKTALTTSYVHLRSGKSVNSTILTSIVAGTTVELRSDADDTWQGVTYQGKNGYIYRAYLQY